jgi:hypothetical protein
MNFGQFSKAATGETPYDCQSRLAGGDSGKPCSSQLINIPTGLGKTAAVVFASMWNRVGQIARRTAAGRAEYFAAFEATYRRNWQHRLTEAQTD